MRRSGKLKIFVAIVLAVVLFPAFAFAACPCPHAAQPAPKVSGFQAVPFHDCCKGMTLLPTAHDIAVLTQALHFSVNKEVPLFDVLAFETAAIPSSLTAAQDTSPGFASSSSEPLYLLIQVFRI